MTTHQLTPIEPPYDPHIDQILQRYPKAEDGYILKLFRVFANSTRFLTSKGVVNLLDRDSPISLREREIVILRVTANNHCEYEWGVHVAAFAQTARLSDAQIQATRLSPWDAPCWSEKEQLLIRCIDQLCDHSLIQDDTYAAFQADWDLNQQLEILALCGNYHTISFVANTARLTPEEMGARFPTTSR